MIITRAHARRPRRVRSIYNLAGATSASSSSATCTSTSDSASPTHVRRQLEAQVEIYELTIQLLMQTSGSGKDYNKTAVSKILCTLDILHVACDA